MPDAPTRFQQKPVSVGTLYSILGGGDLPTNLRLDGDVESPGGNKMYGTDQYGQRAWLDIPVSGGGAGTGDVVSDVSVSVADELVKFTGTTGKHITRATGTGLAKLTSGVLSVISDNSTNWDAAFTDRMKWDGGATGLVAATGRTSLGLVIGTNVEAWSANLDAWSLLSTSSKQASDTQLTSLSALSYTGNALKVVRVNAGETDFELVTPAAATPGGSNTQLQYNNSGSFGGVTNAAWNGTSLFLKDIIVSPDLIEGVTVDGSVQLSTYHTARFRASTSNRWSIINCTPNGTGSSAFQFLGSDNIADPSNFHLMNIISAGGGGGLAYYSIGTQAVGTATLYPININTGGASHLYVGTDGGVSIGTAAAAGSTNLKVAGTITGSNLSGTNTGDQTLVGLGGVPTTRSLTIGATSQDLSANRTWLASVTNDAQTKASIVPNTAPSSGQLLVGNAGGTAYAPVSLSGSGATMSLASTGVLTISAIPNASLSNSAITIAGTSTSLGGSITQDTITGLGSTGIVKRTAANTLGIAVADTDYVSVAGNKGGWTALKVAGSDFTTSSASLVDVTGLVSGTLSVATLYEFEANLYVNSSSTAGMAVGVQQAGTGSGMIGVWSGAATSATATGIVIASNALNQAGAPCVLVAGDGSIQIRGFIKTGTTGTPTISLKVLKTTSGTAKVYIGSTLRYRTA